MRVRTRWLGVSLMGLVLFGLSLPAAAQFKPGDRGIPSESWSTWHGLAPANKSKQVDVALTASSDDTVSFGFTMDYIWFNCTADCQIRAVVTPSDLATAASIDTTNFITLPSGSSGTIAEQWSGIIIRGSGSGNFYSRAVGRTY